jgi:hypothetical protein
MPLTLVTGSPSCGQYAVASGTYTISACDVNKPLIYSFIANCGAGTSNAVYAANCLTDTLHPNNLGHAVILAAAKAAINPQLLFPGAPSDLTQAQTPQAQTPKDWVTPNPYGLTAATAWNPGIAWVKSSGNVWGSTFKSGQGVVHIAPSGGAHSAWCTYPGSSPYFGPLPKDSSTLSCPVWINAGGLYAGYTSTGHAALYSDTLNNYFNLGGQGVTTEYSTFNFLPQTPATSGANQSSPAQVFNAFTWNGSASAQDSYTWKNTAANGTQSTHLTLTHSLNSCIPGPCTWDVDISGSTGSNKLGNVQTGPNSNLQAANIQAQTVALGALQNYIQNSVTMTGPGWASGTATVTGGQADPFSGSNAVSIQSSASNGNYQNIPTVPNLVNATTYVACGYLKGAAGGEGIQIFMGGFGSGAISGITTSWQYFGPYTWAPTSTLTRTFGIFATTATNQTVYAFGWSVTPGTTCPAFLPTTTPVTTPIQAVYSPLTIAAAALPSVLYSAAGPALPGCSAAIKGQSAVVSDATSPAYLGTYTSGGTVATPVMCNGTNWVTY